MGIFDLLQSEPKRKTIPQLQMELLRLNAEIDKKTQELVTKGRSQDQVLIILDPLMDQKSILTERIGRLNAKAKSIKSEIKKEEPKSLMPNSQRKVALKRELTKITGREE